MKKTFDGNHPDFRKEEILSFMMLLRPPLLMPDEKPMPKPGNVFFEVPLSFEIQLFTHRIKSRYKVCRRQ